MQRIWQAHDLQPHRMRTFKRSNDPDFAAKLEDIVGLYIAPPKHAIVLSVDEKSQMQALDRTQPGLPLKPGKAGTMTHDYKRHGTTTLFAALDVLQGTVISRCMQRHRHQEFIRFLNAVERAVPAGKVVHAILDNYAADKHPRVLVWLGRHSRWTFHFTPTSGSWLNAVETFFSALTRRRIRRGSFRSIVDLQAAINRYIAEHNTDPKPFIWTKPADQILAKVNRRMRLCTRSPEHASLLELRYVDLAPGEALLQNVERRGRGLAGRPEQRVLRAAEPAHQEHDHADQDGEEQVQHQKAEEHVEQTAIPHHPRAP